MSICFPSKKTNANTDGVEKSNNSLFLTYYFVAENKSRISTTKTVDSKKQSRQRHILSFPFNNTRRIMSWHILKRMNASYETFIM